MKAFKYLSIGALCLMLLSSCGGGNSKTFNPKEKESSMSDTERQQAIEAYKSSLAVNPSAMMNSNDVKLSVLPPAPEGDLNEALSEKIAVKMLQIISQNGIGGLNTVPGFALTATLTPGEKKVTGTAPQKMIASYTINYSVINTITGDVYASAAQQITGTGASFEQATANAVSQINDSPEMQQMLATASEKIIAWFNDNLETFQQQVQSAIGQGDYALALSLIESVPQKATAAFEYAQSRHEEVLGKFMEKISADELVALRQALQEAQGNPSPEVYAHFKMIATTSPEYEQAKALMDSYESNVQTTLAENRTAEAAKAEADAQRALQIELATIEADKVKAVYQARATEQALRQHMRDKDDKNRGFWGSLGARIIGAIDSYTDSASEPDVVGANLPSSQGK